MNLFSMSMFLTITTDSLIIAATGYFIVFVVLLSLYLIFDRLPLVLGIVTRAQKRARRMRESLIKQNGHPIDPETVLVTGEVCAAIATGLHLYFEEQHDEEARQLTIHKISRTYSPWSSKIHSVNQPFNQRIR